MTRANRRTSMPSFVATSAMTLSMLALACSAGPSNSDGTGGTGTSTGNDPLGTGGGTGIVVTQDETPTVTDERDVPVREEVCVDGVCTCLTLALLGSLESAADRTDTQPFVDWLNNNSGGSAVVTMVTEKPAELTADWLAQYDILLVANVNGWTFSQAEKDAVAAWSNDTGGGIVSLTGFVSTGTEPAATSQLIEFSNISYTTVRAAEGGQSEPVYFKDSSTNVKKCLSWPENRDAETTTPIEFAAAAGSMELLTTNLDYVGAFIGFGVNAPEDATVIATDPMSAQPIAVAKEVNEKGRVFVFGDEWVIFKNQWEVTGSPDDQTEAEHNVCWVPEAVDEEGGVTPSYFHSVETLYQTKQFWYNAINYVAPPNECFVIEDESVVIVK